MSGTGAGVHPRWSAPRVACAVSLALLTLAGCARRAARDDTIAVRDVTPAFLSSAGAWAPAIAADAQGRVALIWITRDSLGTNLWLAVSLDSGLAFDRPTRVNLRAGHVVWDPDARPALALGPAGQLAIAWSEAGKGGGLDLVVRASGDAGATLGMPANLPVPEPTAPAVPARRGRRARAIAPPAPPPAASQGFPALAFLPDGSLFAAWLERGASADVGTLRAAGSHDGGAVWSAPIAVTDSASARCQPSIQCDAAGRIAIAYRAAAGGLRDPALAVSIDRGQTFPLDTIASADRWRVEACPTEPPALSWNEPGGGTLAWFTGASPAGVFLMPWHPDHGGAGIKRPIAAGAPRARRPRLSGVPGTTWLAVASSDTPDSAGAVLAVTAFQRDGGHTPWTRLGAGAGDGAIAALDARTAIACWTEPGDRASRLRVVRLNRR